MKSYKKSLKSDPCTTLANSVAQVMMVQTHQDSGADGAPL